MVLMRCAYRCYCCCCDMCVGCYSATETGQYAVSASEDGTARVWSMAKKKTIGVINTGEEAEVLRVALLDTQRAMQLVTCSADGVASIWKRQEAKRPYEVVQQLQHNDGQLYACERLGNGSSLLTAADDTVYVWDLEHEEKQQWCFDKRGAYRFGGERNPDDEVVVFDAKPAPEQTDVIGLALSDGTFRLLDVRERDNQTTIQASETHLAAFSWQDVHTMFACSGDGVCSSWDLRTSQRIFAQQAHERTVFGAALVGRNWLTYSSDCLLKVWSVDTAAGAMHPVTTFALDRFPVYSCAVDPDRRLILCAGGMSAATPVVGTPLQLLKYKNEA